MKGLVSGYSIEQELQSMDWIEELPEEVRIFVEKLRSLPDFPLNLAKLASALHQRSHTKDAIARDLALRAWTLAQNDPKVRFATDWAVRKSVPRWHFSIVRDHVRNTLYKKAIEYYVTPDKTVLEIGTGTGILSMLAARAGAKHVYTCEMEPLIAEAAKENIEKNGFSHKITIIAKKSTDLVMGRDLPEEVDVLVSEIVDDGLLRENVLPVMEDARRRLIKPDATVLPSRVAIRGTLVGGPEWTGLYCTSEVLGFDLSAFNRFQPAVQTMRIDGRSIDNALSPVVELFRFDFEGLCIFPEERKILSMPVIKDGTADAFLSWIWLDFGDSIEFENKPPIVSSWNPQLHFFTHSIPVHAGDVLRLAAEHDRRAAIVYPVL
jgi:2-polyprenyl-3-methyl-5-hydroxy-6-metoxy-1,4-benzoquinol methylase